MDGKEGERGEELKGEGGCEGNERERNGRGREKQKERTGMHQEVVGSLKSHRSLY